MPPPEGRRESGFRDRASPSSVVAKPIESLPTDYLEKRGFWQRDFARTAKEA